MRAVAARSISSTSGRATASPTTGTLTQLSRTAVPSASAGSIRCTLSGITTEPPVVIMWNADHCAAPCMNGGSISSRSPPAASFAACAISS